MMEVAEILEYLRCAVCAGTELRENTHHHNSIRCSSCGTVYPMEDGILDLLPPQFRPGDGSAGDAAEAHYWEEEEEVYRPYDHEVAQGFAQQRANYLRGTLPFGEIHSAIDVGSGNGMSTHCIEAHIDTLFSLDSSKHLLSANPARLRLRADAYRLPFRDQSVDLVYSWELLHHVERPRTVLSEMRRVARRFVFFFDPNRWNPAQAAHALVNKPNRKVLRNTDGYFRKEIDASGLRIVTHDTVGWLTPNIPPVWLYRVFRHFPFRVPAVGVSHFYLLQCR